MFVPLLFVLLAMSSRLVFEEPLERWLAAGAGTGEKGAREEKGATSRGNHPPPTPDALRKMKEHCYFVSAKQSGKRKRGEEL